MIGHHLDEVVEVRREAAPPGGERVPAPASRGAPAGPREALLLGEAARASWIHIYEYTRHYSVHLQQTILLYKSRLHLSVRSGDNRWLMTSLQKLDRDCCEMIVQSFDRRVFELECYWCRDEANKM